MSTQHRPFVPETAKMPEFTWRALLLGLVMTAVLGAANAYLGLRAGMTIAATYPAAVIGMAVLRVRKGSILEENIARTAGTIGESVAAGAVFTLPAFLLAHSWPSFEPKDAYWKSTALMIVGSVLGVLFVSLVRRVMVEDESLPFPESVAASEIHKAGRRGAEAAKHLFWNIGVGGATFLLGALQLFSPDKDFMIRVGTMGQSKLTMSGARQVPVGGMSLLSAPTVSPAYLGVGYIIGPELAALNFSGGVIAWGLLVPMVIYFLGPQLQTYLPVGAASEDWASLANDVWRFIVRPIAVGGMLAGAAYTLFKMRKNLAEGLGRAVREVGLKSTDIDKLSRTEQYMTSKTVFSLIAVVFAAMVGLYVYLSGNAMVGIVAGVVMLIVGFFFATVSGYLVGIIGSSNNPISGLTLSTLIIAALLLIALGATGVGGVAAVLGVAAVVCVSSAVAGELLQDFKVGYILGGTPRRIQMAELVAVVVASAVMYFPLFVLHEANIKSGGIGFGDKQLSAPQAGLMATLAQGIVGGGMPWPLVMVGIAMGIAMIMLRMKSPMLMAVGMYLPFNTTFAIFVGGVLRWISDRLRERRGLNEAQKARVENTGVLAASGLIAGESLMGLATATLVFFRGGLPKLPLNTGFAGGVVVLAALAGWMVWLPLKNAGSPDEPAPPAVMI